VGCRPGGGTLDGGMCQVRGGCPPHKTLRYNCHKKILGMPLQTGPPSWGRGRTDKAPKLCRLYSLRISLGHSGASRKTQKGGEVGAGRRTVDRFPTDFCKAGGRAQSRATTTEEKRESFVG